MHLALARLPLGSRRLIDGLTVSGLSPESRKGLLQAKNAAQATMCDAEWCRPARLDIQSSPVVLCPLVFASSLCPIRLRERTEYCGGSMPPIRDAPSPIVKLAR